MNVLDLRGVDAERGSRDTMAARVDAERNGNGHLRADNQPRRVDFHVLVFDERRDHEQHYRKQKTQCDQAPGDIE